MRRILTQLSLGLALASVAWPAAVAEPLENSTSPAVGGLRSSTILASDQTDPLLKIADYRSQAKFVALRLHPGQDLRAQLVELCRRQQVGAACIVTCVGSLQKAVLRFANQSETTQLEGPFEIVSLVGTLGRDGVHLHLSLSDSEGRTIGGHLVDGSEVYTTAEIVLAILEDLEFKRTLDVQTKSRELEITPRSSR